MNSLDNIPHEYIGRRLRWLGIRVDDMKEKWGTYRVYCSFGLTDIHSLMYPGYHYVQFTGWKKDLYYRTSGIQASVFHYTVNWWLIPLQRKWYRKVYQMAIRKFPDRSRAILVGADEWDLLGGLDPRLIMTTDSAGISRWHWTGNSNDTES